VFNVFHVIKNTGNVFMIMENAHPRDALGSILKDDSGGEEADRGTVFFSSSYLLDKCNPKIPIPGEKSFKP
jgi:hypothetical protein